MGEDNEAMSVLLCGGKRKAWAEKDAPVMVIWKRWENELW